MGLSIREASEILLKWFNDNLTRINADKYYLLVSKNNPVKIETNNFDITNSKSEKLLGVKFDHKLFSMTTFQKYVKRLVECVL